MRASDLRKRVIIEQRSSSIDSEGGQAITWSTFAVIWAGIEPLTGRELLAAQEVQSEVTHQVQIRYLAGINTKMRVNYSGRYFNIHAVIDENERHRQMTLLTSEGLNDG
jgi:SPP1 family predicted phage head-tail adaptor